MTQMLANRLTTVPQQSFLNCVSLSIREENLNTSELDGLHGGNPLGYFVRELPRIYRAGQQAINRGMPPVLIEFVDGVIDEVSDAIENFEEGMTGSENGLNGWVPGIGYIE